MTNAKCSISKKKKKKSTEINSHLSCTERPNCTLSPGRTRNFLISTISREGESRVSLPKRALHENSARAHARKHARIP